MLIDGHKKREQEAAHQLCSHKQLGRLLMSSYCLSFSPRLPSISSTIRLLSFLHTSLRFLPCIPMLHAPSVFVSLRRLVLLHVPHFYDTLVSLRQINPKIYYRAGVVYNITVSGLKKKSLNIANNFDTFHWLEF